MTDKDSIRIVIADDHPLYLEAVERQLARAFRRAEIRTFSRFADVLSFLAEQPASLIMVDYSMPELAADGLKCIIAAAGGAPVVVMSGVAAAKDVAACIAFGARGFLPKTMDGPVFTDAVSLVLHGGTYLPTEFIGTVLALAQADLPEGIGIKPVDLSPREHDLLCMVAAGASNKEIGRKMNLQEVTVKFYLTRLFRRLDVKNRSQAAVVAVKMGLAAPGAADVT